MQAWRRVDWRFLLPTLELGHVLCLDGGDTSLPAAIRLAGGTVSGLSASSPGGIDGAPPDPVVFDGAALVAPSPAELAAAVRAVRPGGWVYAEVRRHVRAAHPGPRSLGGCGRQFDRAGLRHIETFWHAPDFATCTRIVPLAGTAAVRNALGRHHAERFGAAKSLAGRAALATGLFSLAVPEGSVLGRRPVADGLGPAAGAPGRR